jgi:hypothetical protein
MHAAWLLFSILFLVHEASCLDDIYALRHAVRSPVLSEPREFKVASKLDHDKDLRSFIAAAMYHDEKSEIFRSVEHLMLACAKYRDSKALMTFLTDNAPEFHPVHFSPRNNLACFSFISSKQSVLYKSLVENNAYAVAPMPTAMKLDESVERLASDIESGLSSASSLILEIGIGLGARGKNSSKSTKATVVQEILRSAERMLSDREEMNLHWGRFFYTSDIAVTEKLSSETRRSRYLSVYQTPACHFSRLVVEEGISAVSFSSDVLDASCWRLLASVASLHPQVNLVSANLGVKFLSQVELSSAPWYNVTAAPTDQNAWVQSGNSVDTPVSIKIRIPNHRSISGLFDFMNTVLRYWYYRQWLRGGIH